MSTHANVGVNARTSEAKKVVILNIGGLKLILPQADIRTVESVVDVDPRDPPENGAGWINYLGQRWPTYCLSDELGFLPDSPVTRRACILLALTTGYLGLICDDVRVVVNFSAPDFDLPASMRLPHSPLSGLVKYEESLACVSDADRLAVFVTYHKAHENICA